MKRMIKKFIVRIIRFVYRQLPIVGVDGFNLHEVIRLKAAMDTADYCIVHLPRVPAFNSAFDLLSFALTQVTITGAYLEFGVASGATINHISRQVQGIVHGFDSFEGLPEDWRTGYPKGAFSQKPPAVNSNVEFHVGTFDITLPKFVSKNSQPVAFLHIDCDLYSSTKEIFRCLSHQILPKTVIVFDEYFNHPTWRQDEWLAFQEFVGSKGLSYKYLGYVPNSQQVCVIIG